MSFNIEWGGTHVRFASIAEAIEAAGADVAGIQEPEGNLERLAGDLGWHFNRRNHVISKYPLIDPPGGDGRFLFVEVRPGRVVAMANVHLPSDPYGPYWLREGRAPAEVKALEREVRLSALQPLLDTLTPIHRRGVPLFLTGDFNAPSHQDWTEAAVDRFPHRDFTFNWPVSRAVAAAGFSDSYRTAHPDPVSRPGFTWWAARPRIEDYNPSDSTDQGRIDFVWYAGAATLRESRIVGETGARDVSVTVSPWPSDHRAVVSEFFVNPAPMPVLVTTERRVHASGERIGIVWRAPGAGASITLLSENRADDAAPERRIALESTTGSLDLSSDGLPPDRYRIALRDPEGRTISRNEFWLLQADARPTVTVGAQTIPEGQSIPIAWRNAPGNRLDWIAIFDVQAEADSRHYLTYCYIGAQSSGSLQLGERTAEETWPLPPGRYVARLLQDDGFVLLAQSPPFVVEGREPEPVSAEAK
jgi:endonuclease/exonuclease/phosphatase family metal-dependent hydrolase